MKPNRATRCGRRAALALVMGLVLSLVAGVAGATGNGDLNGDGKVDAGDVLLLYRALHGQVTLTPAEQAAADVAPMVGGVSQPDGKVNEGDLLLLLRALEGADVDGDGLGPAAEQQGGTSLFSSDTNGDGIPDNLEDSDGDGLNAFEEQALGSSSADPSGIGSADPAYTPVLANPVTYPDTQTIHPLVLFYASRPSANLARLAPLKQLLLADGYTVADFTDPPPPAGVDLFKFPFNGCPSSWPTCGQYMYDLGKADIFVLVEPSQPIDSTEAQAISALLSIDDTAVLSLVERQGNAQLLVSDLGATIAGEDVTHEPPSCPPGLGTCPPGWSTFQTGNSSLDSTSPVVTGSGPSQTLSSVTDFLAGALDGPPLVQYTPDTRYPATYRSDLTYPSGSTAQTPSGPVDAAGLSAGLSVDVPRNLCGVDMLLHRRFFSADIESMTTLVDGTGAKRGFLAPGRNDDQQMTLNVFHWLDGTLDPPPPVPEWELITANQVCSGQQTDDPGYNPTISSPTYAVGTGPQWLFDDSHQNNSKLNGNYHGFEKLLEADGYRIQSSSNTFDSANYFNGIEGLVVENPHTAITQSEASAVFNFVQGGGSLLLIVDHMPYPTNVEPYLAPLLGIDFPTTDLGSEGIASAPPDCRPYAPGCVISNIVYSTSPLNSAEGQLVTGNPVIDGRGANESVSLVRSFFGSGFETTANASQIGVHVPVIDFPSTAIFSDTGNSAAGLLQGMTIEIGSGRVYVSSEAGMFTAQIQGYTDQLDANGQVVLDANGNPVQVPYGQWGMNSEPGDQQLLLNVMHWLDHLD